MSAWLYFGVIFAAVFLPGAIAVLITRGEQPRPDVTEVYARQLADTELLLREER